jgi:hypothetical protein
MTTRNATRYRPQFKNKSSKQSGSDYDEEVYRNSRSAKPLVALLSVVMAFWFGVMIWIIRAVFA